MKKIIKELKRRTVNAIKGNEGMGVIEVVLIILVLVGLAFIFKTQISSVADSIYKSIKEQVDKF